MPLYDENKIMDDITAVEVCQELGIKMKKSGKSISVLCPFHGDNHFGSAVLTDHGMHCFVCNETWKLTDYIMEAENLSKMDALKIIGDIAGGAEKYIIKKSRKKKNDEEKYFSGFPFTSKQVELIGLNLDGSIKSVINQSKKEETSDDYYSERIKADEYLISKKKQKYSLRNLYEEDKDFCLSMMREKADKKLNLCKDFIYFFSQSDDVEAINFVSDYIEIFYELKNIICIIDEEQRKLVS